MNASPPDTNTVCPARLGSDQPWMTAEVSFGVRSLVVQPLDVDAGAVWVPYEDVTALDELGGDTPVDAQDGRGGIGVTHEVEAVLRDGRTLALRLDDERLDLLVAALGASRNPVDTEPAKPAMFGVDRSADETIDLRSSPGSPHDLHATETTGSAVHAPPDISPAPVATSGPGAVANNAADRRRWLLIGLAATVLLVVLVLGLVDLLGGDDNGTLAVPDDSTESPATETSVDTSGPDESGAGGSTTVAPTTVPTPSVSSLRVGVIDVQMGGDAAAPSIYVSFDIENTADQAIVAYELELAVGDPGSNGAAEWVVPLACSSVPLEPGVPLSGDYSPGDTAGNAPQLANCSVAGWPVDPANPQQSAVAAALAKGIDVRSSVAVVSVTFADGTTVDAGGVD